MFELKYNSAAKFAEGRTSPATASAPVLSRETKAHHADPSALLWYSAAVVIVCLGWLSYIIFVASN